MQNSRILTQSVVLTLAVSLSFSCYGQGTADVYRKPLKEVIPVIEKEFGVKLAFDEADVAGKTVNYAAWRIASNVETTLDNVLKPLDLSWEKSGDHSYHISNFEYYRRSEEEGKKHLDKLLSTYETSKEFDSRRKDLRACITEALGIKRLGNRLPPQAIRGAELKMNGYTVQNVGIETIPGYYLTGTMYKPLKGKGPFPVILSPHGHFYNEADPSIPQDSARYRADMQYRCAALARMGAIVLNYDMYSWGESVLFSGDRAHHQTGFALAMQTWNSMRALDFLLSLPKVDAHNVGVTGASGGGTQTILLTALDDRVTTSVPVVMVSSAFFGGCPCESGLPIHASCNGNRTNNAEIAALAAPRPQLLISDGDDWTRSMPQIDFPYLKKVYDFYGKGENVEQFYLPDDHHDYGLSKRLPMYRFFAKTLHLNLQAITTKDGTIDESAITIQRPEAMRVFRNGVRIPATALRSHDEIVAAFKKYQSSASE